jgi:acyl-coenzyme A thioesterase PaaI-like protein
VGQGKYSNCTTVSQNTSFMRPVMGRDILATGRVVKSGRSLVFGEVTLRAEGDERAICVGTSTYMMLPE